MTAPLSSISGLISGFQSTDLVDAILAQARVPAVRMEAELGVIQAQRTAFTTYRSLLDGLRSAATTLRSGTAFDAMSATTTVLTGSGPLATVSASAAAAEGSFTLAVEQLARAERLGSTSITDPAAALGLSGSFTIHGASMSVTAEDSLLDLRDRINNLAAGTPPVAVRATILSVSPTDHRLILASTESGEAGLALADTGGDVLQSLGFLDGLGAKAAGAVLTQGADARFRIDGLLMVRSTNVITDVLEGITLTLTREETGASTAVEVGRFADAAQGAMQKFVDAYNSVVRFLQEQGTVTSSRPSLYGEALLRSARSGLPTLLLGEIGGAAAGMASVARAGLSLGRDGLLTLDAQLFTAAFTGRHNDLRTLFTERLSATGSNLSLVSTGAHPAGGSWNVTITSLATRGQVASNGFSGVYDDGGTPDTLQVTDLSTGRTTSVTLTTGLTTAEIQSLLEAAFQADGLNLTTELQGNDLRIQSLAYGSQAGVAVAVENTGDGASELFSAPAQNLGTDVSGTIGGEAATGSGQVLVGNPGGAAAGISILYTGADTGSVGDVTASIGAGARVERMLDAFLRTGDGMLDGKMAQLDARTERLEARILALDARLARRREVLLRSFLMMENAVAAMQRQSASLLAFTQQNQER